MDTRHRKIDIGNIEHKTEKDRYRATLDTRHRKKDTVNNGQKTQKDRGG